MNSRYLIYFRDYVLGKKHTLKFYFNDFSVILEFCKRNGIEGFLLYEIDPDYLNSNVTNYVFSTCFKYKKDGWLSDPKWEIE
ncbi:hypothetical protein [Dipodfec virus UA06Rod_21]|uniref:Uncharacterized protein n=1 Tax=Dipodfec virus UA06Rod_21 TaxID=2929321 RepID=A0A976N180_9VIRU|nr:hypothetical protein [Dipodfec virus UA06Rod_21]